MSVPHYHQQPATLDERVELPSDPPLAQGHSPERASDVAGALDEHKAAVAAEPEQEVGARAPGDHAGESTTTTTDGVPEGTVDEVMAWVGDDPQRAQQALDAERAGQNRSTLIAQLEALV